MRPLGQVMRTTSTEVLIAGIECQRHAFVELALIESAGFDFDQRVLRQFEAADAFELDANPVMQAGLIAQVMNAAVGIDADAVDPAVCRRNRRSLDFRCRRLPVVWLDCVVAAEMIAIEDRRVVAVEHSEIEGFAVGVDAQFLRGGDVAFDEGKVGGAIRPARGALIAHQRGLGAEQDEIEIVVVIVIEPDGTCRSGGREVSRAGGRICRRCCDRAAGPFVVRTQRSIRPSLSKSPGATTITPVRPSRPVAGASCWPRRNIVDPLDDQTSRSVWPVPVESIRVMPAVAASTVRGSSCVRCNWRRCRVACGLAAARIVDFGVVRTTRRLRESPRFSAAVCTRWKSAR